MGGAGATSCDAGSELVLRETAWDEVVSGRGDRYEGAAKNRKNKRAE